MNKIRVLDSLNKRLYKEKRLERGKVFTKYYKRWTNATKHIRKKIKQFPNYSDNDKHESKVEDEQKTCDKNIRKIIECYKKCR